MYGKFNITFNIVSIQFNIITFTFFPSNVRTHTHKDQEFFLMATIAHLQGEGVKIHTLWVFNMCILPYFKWSFSCASTITLTNLTLLYHFIFSLSFLRKRKDFQQPFSILIRGNKYIR